MRLSLFCMLFDVERANALFWLHDLDCHAGGQPFRRGDAVG